jgi:hypothetical protein
MTIWMSWTLAASILLAFSATLIARVATYFGLARRFVWTGAMIIAAGAPRLLSVAWTQAIRRRRPSGR